jgi:hypothetical protein
MRSAMAILVTLILCLPVLAADISVDVDAAVVVPVNLMPLVDATDGKTLEEALAYNEAGLDLDFIFVTSAGAVTKTDVTPTTGGVYDWTHVGSGIYAIEIPASAGGSINNDTEGHGWFVGDTTASLPWRGPVIEFRSSVINDAMTDGGDYLPVDTVQLAGTTQDATDLADFAAAGYDPTNNGTNVYTVRGAAPKTDADVQAACDLAMDGLGLQYLWDTAISAQPTSGSLFYDLTEDNSGTQRFTTAALANAPAGGGGGGDATAANQTTIINALAVVDGIVDEVVADTRLWDTQTELRTILYGSDTAGATAANQTTMDGKLDTIDGIVDDILADVVAILVDTGTTLDNKIDALTTILNKLDDTLEDDSGTYRFTENALEQGPGGGTGADITIE